MLLVETCELVDREVTNTGANESGSAAKKFIGVDNVEQWWAKEIPSESSLGHCVKWMARTFRPFVNLSNMGSSDHTLRSHKSVSVTNSLLKFQDIATHLWNAITDGGSAAMRSKAISVWVDWIGSYNKKASSPKAIWGGKKSLTVSELDNLTPQNPQQHGSQS